MCIRNYLANSIRYTPLEACIAILFSNYQLPTELPGCDPDFQQTIIMF